MIIIKNMYPKAVGFAREQERVDSPVRLAKNEVVSATVLKASGQTALLLMKGHEYTAETHIPLKTGLVLRLAVRELSTMPVLQLLDIQYPRGEAVNIAVILSALKDNFWKSMLAKIGSAGTAAEKNTWNKIIKILPEQLLKGDGPACLQKMIEGSGMSWEAKLASAITRKGSEAAIKELIDSDIKGLVSRIMARSAEADEQAAQLLLALKNLQLLNEKGLAREDKIFLPLPVQLPDGDMIIQLLIQLPPKMEEGAKGYLRYNRPMRVSLLLELAGIGPVRADFELKGNTVSGAFNVATPEAMELFESGLPELAKSLEEKGFTVQRIECRLKEPEIVAEPLIHEIESGITNNIHLVA